MRAVLRFVLLLAAALVLGQASTAQAQFVPGDALISPGYSGTTQFDRWLDLTLAANPGYPGFPGSAPWPSPIGSNQPGSGDAVLNKVSNGTGGGAYPAGAGLYFGGFSSTINNPGGTLSVSDSTPVANLATIGFQIQIGEAWTYDFLNGILPTLSYNGGAQNLAATSWQLLEQYDNGTVTMPSGPETVYINTYYLTWDTTSLGAISDFTISFDGVQHAQVYGLQLDQSDTAVAVPEPGTWALAGALLIGGIVYRKRFRKAAREPVAIPAVDA